MQNRRFPILKCLLILLFTLLLSCFLVNPEEKPLTETYHYVHSKSEIIGEWVFFYSYICNNFISGSCNLDPYLEEDILFIDSPYIRWRFLIDGNYKEYSFPYILYPTILDTTSAIIKMDTVLHIHPPGHHAGNIFEAYPIAQIKRFHDTLEISKSFLGVANDFEIAHYVLKKW
jgi:hypothetical protein